MTSNNEEYEIYLLVTQAKNMLSDLDMELVSESGRWRINGDGTFWYFDYLSEVFGFIEGYSACDLKNRDEKIIKDEEQFDIKFRDLVNSMYDYVLSSDAALIEFNGEKGILIRTVNGFTDACINEGLMFFGENGNCNFVSDEDIGNDCKVRVIKRNLF